MTDPQSVCPTGPTRGHGRSCLLPSENVATRTRRDPVAGERHIEGITAVAGHGGLVRADGALPSSAIEVAARHGITDHDATYVAAAERFGAELVSHYVWELFSRCLVRLPSDLAHFRGTGKSMTRPLIVALDPSCGPTYSLSSREVSADRRGEGRRSRTAS